MKDIEKFVRNKLGDFFVDKHVKNVVIEANKLCEYYPDADKEIVELGAWLHDIGHDIKGTNVNQESRKEHHRIGAERAREYLNSINYSQDKTERVLHCIEAHRTSKPPAPKTIEAKIVADADNLAHFAFFDIITNITDLEFAKAKIQRDSKVLILPETKKRANKLWEKIKIKHNITD